MNDAIVFDTGPIISLATNNLLWVLQKLKNNFVGEFYITKGVKGECVERPLTTKKFKFEALQVLKIINDDTLKIYQESLDTNKMLDIANNTFFAHDNPIRIVHFAEMEVIAAAVKLECKKIVVDERTTRLLIDDPAKLKRRLEKKLHTSVYVDENNLSILKKMFGNITVLRSTELIYAAYELGILDDYIIKGIKQPKKELLEGLLWGLKLHGCSIREDEIDEIISMA